MRALFITKNQEGAVLIEFALVSGLLLCLLFGAVEFGLMFYNKQLLTSISGQVARDAINQCNDNNSGCNPTGLVRTLADRLCGFNVPDGTIVPRLINLYLDQDNYLNIQPTTAGLNNAWEITISATYRPIVTTLIGIDTQIPIKGIAVMVKERP